MKTDTQRDYEQRILHVLVHIQTHLDLALDLEELASLAHFSPYHFHRIFRGMVGEPVMEHVRRLRLERAAYQLKSLDRPITQIAFDAGYESHEAFTRAFRALFDASPSEFRKVHRRIPVRGAPSGVHFTLDGAIDSFQPVQGALDSMNVRIEELKPKRVAFMRHVGPYDRVSTTWQKFVMWAGAHGLFGQNAKLLAVVHDDPEITPPEKLRYDACIEVHDLMQAEGEIGVQEIAGGQYAIATHKGPYERLGDVYAEMMGQWLPANDREPATPPCFEVYLNNPQQTAPEQLLTEVYLPVKRTRRP